jgi:hypothetical protein
LYGVEVPSKFHEFGSKLIISFGGLGRQLLTGITVFSLGPPNNRYGETRDDSSGMVSDKMTVIVVFGKVASFEVSG